MNRMQKFGWGVAALAIAGTASMVALAQERSTPKKYTDVTWWQMMHVDYHPQHTEAALQMVKEKFLPAGERSGMSAPRMYEYSTGGEWDLTIMVRMESGPGELEWEMSPESIKWLETLAGMEGGMEAAQQTMDTYLSMINRHEKHLVREAAPKASAARGATR